MREERTGNGSSRLGTRIGRSDTSCNTRWEDLRHAEKHAFLVSRSGVLRVISTLPLHPAYDKGKQDVISGQLLDIFKADDALYHFMVTCSGETLAR